MATEGTITILLCSCGNIDYGQTTPQSAPGLAAVDSIEEACRAARTYITENDLGGGNWGGKAGECYAEDGEYLGRVSYNGRFWAADHEYGAKR